MWKSASRSINGVSLARRFSQTSTVTYLFNCIFETDIDREHIRKDWKKPSDNFFSFGGVTITGQNEKILTAVKIDFNQLNYSVWLLSVLSRHNFILIQFTRTIMHHQEKNDEDHCFLSWWTKAVHIKSTNII